MERLDKVLDPLLEFHLASMAYAETFKAGASLKKLHPEAWLCNTGRIAVNPGRQTGKSSYIARAAADKDIILCPDTHSFDHMVARRRGFFLPDPHNMRVYLIEFGMTFPDDIQDVWIDSPGYVSDSDYSWLYSTLAGKCRRFILIG